MWGESEIDCYQMTVAEEEESAVIHSSKNNSPVNRNLL